MALRRVVGSSLLCGGCRTQIVRSFLATAGIETIPTRHRPGSWHTTRNMPFQQASAFSQSTPVLAHDDPVVDQDEESVSGSDTRLYELAESTEPPQDQPPSNESYVPWYLQVDPPIAQQDHPLSERQRIPDLPDAAPPLLEPLLKHVSVELGMDDLSLLDLRSLDPPPALGGNLLMIIGTARSEKHLHVSADRLCRWLRSSHALSPFADGLLGRNELKLKLRRKAKRSRLLSAVGAKETASGDVDDGIRTGWVCVNVGRVEGGSHEQSESMAEEPSGFVGFGRRTQGTNIVVQMMTDEKRGQLDLEALWNGILKRAKKREDPERLEGEEGREKIDKGQLLESGARDQSAVSSQPNSSGLFEQPHESGPFRAQQVRAFHTTVREKQKAPFENYTNEQNRSEGMDTDSTASTSIAAMQSMLDHLKGLERGAALEALGSTSSNQLSTAFLSAFYNEIPSFPESVHWELNIELLCYACDLGHPGYPKSRICSALSDMEDACFSPSETTYLLVLRTLMDSSSGASLCTTQSQEDLNPTKSAQISEVLSILDRMHERGLDPLSTPIVTLLHAFTASQQPKPHELSSTPAPPTLSSLLSQALLVPLADAIATASNTPSSSPAWSTVWETWSSYPARFLSRSSAQYTLLLNAVADINLQPSDPDSKADPHPSCPQPVESRISLHSHGAGAKAEEKADADENEDQEDWTQLPPTPQIHAIHALRSCISTMPREDPPVSLRGDVARAVKRCLDVAEPEAEEMAGRGSRNEWAVLWTRVKMAREVEEKEKEKQEEKVVKAAGEKMVDGEMAVET